MLHSCQYFIHEYKITGSVYFYVSFVVHPLHGDRVYWAISGEMECGMTVFCDKLVRIEKVLFMNHNTEKLNQKGHLSEQFSHVGNKHQARTNSFPLLNKLVGWGKKKPFYIYFFFKKKSNVHFALSLRQDKSNA